MFKPVLFLSTPSFWDTKAIFFEVPIFLKIHEDFKKHR